MPETRQKTVSVSGKLKAAYDVRTRKDVTNIVMNNVVEGRLG